MDSQGRRRRRRTASHVRQGLDPETLNPLEGVGGGEAIGFRV